MELPEFIEILEEEGAKLANRNCVLELCKEKATDYQRGRIQGQIDMLTKIMLRLTSKDNDDEDS